MICAKKDFRTRETNITHPTQTTQTTIYTSKKVRYTSLEEEKTENTVRYIQKTDTINGKNAYERCSNQKIPLFLRPWCLIDITTSTICIPNITKKET
ncbi:hypothetical protein GW750_01940 [bacterium]|nr:hypothetical protein [bacterium]